MCIRDSQKNRNREQEVAQASRKAKLLAKELDIPVLLLSQLNQMCIRDSISIIFFNKNETFL